MRPHCVPGGSSSGSGVAVGGNFVPIAIGSDTGGSVRSAAALNGVVGYKVLRGDMKPKELFLYRKHLIPLGR